MDWHCDRCGYKYDDEISVAYTTKWNSTNESDLYAHHVPAKLNLCSNCVLYLLWSRIFPKGIRIYWDEYYLKHTNLVLSRFTRYNLKCRTFDIQYNLLDERTNLYWDEK